MQNTSVAKDQPSRGLEVPSNTEDQRRQSDPLGPITGTGSSRANPTISLETPGKVFAEEAETHAFARTPETHRKRQQLVACCRVALTCCKLSLGSCCWTSLFPYCFSSRPYPNTLLAKDASISTSEAQPSDVAVGDKTGPDDLNAAREEPDHVLGATTVANTKLELLRATNPRGCPEEQTKLSFH